MLQVREVDALGYSAVNFELFNFRPTDDGFVPGTDVRERLTRYEPPESFDVIQIKCWQNPGSRVDLSRLFHEGARFANRRVFPLPFILRHYPIRGETHGRRKVLGEPCQPGDRPPPDATHCPFARVPARRTWSPRCANGQCVEGFRRWGPRRSGGRA